MLALEKQVKELQISLNRYRSSGDQPTSGPHPPRKIRPIQDTKKRNEDRGRSASPRRQKSSASRSIEISEQRTKRNRKRKRKRKRKPRKRKPKTSTKQTREKQREQESILAEKQLFDKFVSIKNRTIHNYSSRILTP